MRAYAMVQLLAIGGAVVTRSSLVVAHVFFAPELVDSPENSVGNARGAIVRRISAECPLRDEERFAEKNATTCRQCATEVKRHHN